MTKQFSGFFVLFKNRLLVALSVAWLGGLLAAGHPGNLEASAGRATVSPVRADLTAFLEPRADTPPPAPAATPAPASASPPPPPPPPAQPELIGTVGYARAGGNCVLEPGINNPGFGNPSAWPVTTQQPFIGATAVFTWNHAGVVTGIWSNGDIEVRHQNYWGGQTRFPRSVVRGFR